MNLFSLLFLINFLCFCISGADGAPPPEVGVNAKTILSMHRDDRLEEKISALPSEPCSVAPMIGTGQKLWIIDPQTQKTTDVSRPPHMICSPSETIDFLQFLTESSLAKLASLFRAQTGQDLALKITPFGSSHSLEERRTNQDRFGSEYPEESGDIREGLGRYKFFLPGYILSLDFDRQSRPFHTDTLNEVKALVDQYEIKQIYFEKGLRSCDATDLPRALEVWEECPTLKEVCFSMKVVPAGWADTLKHVPTKLEVTILADQLNPVNRSRLNGLKGSKFTLKD